MRKWQPLIGTTATLALMALTGPITAENRLSNFTTSTSEPHAVIIGDLAPLGDDVYPVRFTYINGHRVTGNRDTLWLKPGEYRIDATITESASMRDIPGAGVRRPKRARDRIEALEIELEAGKVYRIGARHLYNEEGKDRINWRLEAWRISDAEEEEEADEASVLIRRDDNPMASQNES